MRDRITRGQLQELVDKIMPGYDLDTRCSATYGKHIYQLCHKDHDGDPITGRWWTASEMYSYLYQLSSFRWFQRKLNKREA